MMIGARGGGGGDPRLEIFASEAKEFFSSVRAILGEGDATEARSAKMSMCGYYQSRCICGLGGCKRPTGAGSGGWEQAASRLVPNGPVRALIGS